MRQRAVALVQHPRAAVAGGDRRSVSGRRARGRRRGSGRDRSPRRDRRRRSRASAAGRAAAREHEHRYVDRGHRYRSERRRRAPSAEPRTESRPVLRPSAALQPDAVALDRRRLVARRAGSSAAGPRRGRSSTARRPPRGRARCRALPASAPRTDRRDQIGSLDAPPHGFTVDSGRRDRRHPRGRFGRRLDCHVQCERWEACSCSPCAGASRAALVAYGGTAASGPTYNRDVAPILDAKCASCHRLGGIAPFSLTTAADAKAHAAGIVRMTKAGLMPPWMPGADSAPTHRPRRAAADDRASSRRSPRGRRTARPPGNAADRHSTAVARRRARRARPHDHARAAEGVHRRTPRAAGSTTTTASCSTRSSTQDAFVTARADPAAADRDRPPRDPLRGRRRAGDRRDAAERGERRQGLDVLRRPGPAVRPLRHGVARPARPAAVDRRVGAGPHDERAAERHRRAAAQGREDRDAGALQPDRGRRPRPFAGAAPAAAGDDAADAARDAARRRAGRAAVPRRRHRAAVQPRSRRCRTR